MSALAFRAGADIVTVSVSANNETIAGAIKTARAYEREVLVDTMGVPLERIPERAAVAQALGADYICVHTSLDVPDAPDPLESMRLARQGAPELKLAVAGGINLQTLPRIIAAKPDLIIVGGAICKAVDPIEAAKTMKKMILEEAIQLKTRAIAIASLNELQEIVETVEETELEQMQELILNSNRIFVGAAGRSLLAMKFLAMRLMQIGLKVYLVGEVCTPSIREGDLLLVGSGSGETAGMIAICKKAKAAGAEVAVFTKNRNSTIASIAKVAVQLNTAKPIQEGAAGPDGWIEGNYFSIRPSGNPFEQSIVIVGDAMVCELMQKTNCGTAKIAYNHANLE